MSTSELTPEDYDKVANIQHELLALFRSSSLHTGLLLERYRDLLASGDPDQVRPTPALLVKPSSGLLAYLQYEVWSQLKMGALDATSVVLSLEFSKQDCREGLVAVRAEGLEEELNRLTQSHPAEHPAYLKLLGLPRSSAASLDYPAWLRQLASLNEAWQAPARRALILADFLAAYCKSRKDTVAQVVGSLKPHGFNLEKREMQAIRLHARQEGAVYSLAFRLKTHLMEEADKTAVAA